MKNIKPLAFNTEGENWTDSSGQAWQGTAMARATGETPCMWGNAIVGCGIRHYEYADGSAC